MGCESTGCERPGCERLSVETETPEGWSGIAAAPLARSIVTIATAEQPKIIVAGRIILSKCLLRFVSTVCLPCALHQFTRESIFFVAGFFGLVLLGLIFLELFLFRAGLFAVLVQLVFTGNFGLLCGL